MVLIRIIIRCVKKKKKNITYALEFYEAHKKYKIIKLWRVLSDLRKKKRKKYI